MTQRSSPARGSAGPDSLVRGCFFGLLVLVLAGLGLLLLVLITVPLGGQVSGPVAIIGGFVLFILFHWLTWGWWLGRAIHQEEASGQTGEADDSGN